MTAKLNADIGLNSFCEIDKKYKIRSVMVLKSKKGCNEYQSALLKK